MKAKEMRELNDSDLEHRLLESKHELFNLRFQMATGKQDNSARLGQVRREVARVATILREREIAAAEAAEAVAVQAAPAAPPKNAPEESGE
jgi:large subunit ribosomal protein L29